MKTGNLYQEITDKIIDQLEAGCVPWVRPWGAIGIPTNARTKRPYSGINIVLLWQHDFPTQEWVTFKQALEMGGNVRKGEKGTRIVYADKFVPKSEKGEENPRAIPFLRAYTVFNVAQCDGLPPPPRPPEIPTESVIDPIIRNSGVPVYEDRARAAYIPSQDFIEMPARHTFRSFADWGSTILHELVHATGHPDRLNRDLSNPFGSKLYACEELVAEMGSAFCCARLGLEPTVRHADYLGEWLKVLKEDSRAIIRAASHASKAADWIMERNPS